MWVPLGPKSIINAPSCVLAAHGYCTCGAKCVYMASHMDESRNDLGALTVHAQAQAFRRMKATDCHCAPWSAWIGILSWRMGASCLHHVMTYDLLYMCRYIKLAWSSRGAMLEQLWRTLGCV